MKKKMIFALGFAALLGAGAFYVFQKEKDTDALRKKMKEEDEDFDYWDLDVAEEFDKKPDENSAETPEESTKEEPPVVSE